MGSEIYPPGDKEFHIWMLAGRALSRHRRERVKRDCHLGAAGSRPGYPSFAAATISGDAVDSKFRSEAVEMPKTPLSWSTVAVVTTSLAAAPRAIPVTAMSALRTAGVAPAFRGWLKTPEDRSACPRLLLSRPCSRCRGQCRHPMLASFRGWST